MIKAALFDFCETIADFQTADAYVDFVQKHSVPSHRFIRSLYVFLNKARVMGVLRRIFPKRSLGKKMVLLQMKGRSYSEMDALASRYYEERIKPHFIKETIEELRARKKEGFAIYLVSGGYDIYLKYFASEFGVDGVLSTRIGFENGVCTGKMDGPDCMHGAKLDYIKKSLPEIDRASSFAYSDSATDLPLLSYVGNPVAVSAGHSQKWAEKLGCRQIVWNNKG